jgi:hypothetical protein
MATRGGGTSQTTDGIDYIYRHKYFSQYTRFDFVLFYFLVKIS